MAKCPICDAAVKPRSENPHHPFCTPRCKTIDLGNWVNENYRVPVEDVDDDDADDGSKTPEDMRH